MENNGSAQNSKPEVWMRGPLPGVPPLLQPVAHALLQAQEEIHELLEEFPDEWLWEQPVGVASVGFHLQHIPGILDRLFTYAGGNQLGNSQLKYLSEEGLEDASITVSQLLKNLDDRIKRSVDHLKTMDSAVLTEPRTVGRKKLPTTVLGLLFHAAEHTMRHTGQMLVTAKIMMNNTEDD